MYALHGVENTASHTQGERRRVSKAAAIGAAVVLSAGCALGGSETSLSSEQIVTGVASRYADCDITEVKDHRKLTTKAGLFPRDTVNVSIRTTPAERSAALRTAHSQTVEWDSPYVQVRGLTQSRAGEPQLTGSAYLTDYWGNGEQDPTSFTLYPKHDKIYNRLGARAAVYVGSSAWPKMADPGATSRPTIDVLRYCGVVRRDATQGWVLDGQFKPTTLVPETFTEEGSRP